MIHVHRIGGSPGRTRNREGGGSGNSILAANIMFNNLWTATSVHTINFTTSTALLTFSQQPYFQQTVVKLPCLLHQPWLAWLIHNVEWHELFYCYWDCSVTSSRFHLDSVKHSVASSNLYWRHYTAAAVTSTILSDLYPHKYWLTTFIQCYKWARTHRYAEPAFLDFDPWHTRFMA